jgi:iron(III) transport system substrate-binding protein
MRSYSETIEEREARQMRDESLIPAPKRPFAAALRLLAIATALGLLAMGTAEAGTRLVVYTNFGDAQRERYEAFVEDELDDVSIEWVVDTGSKIVNRLVAEKDAPKADLVWGISTTRSAFLAGKGLLHAYAPVGVRHIKPIFLDKANPPAWVGIGAWTVGICFNTELAKPLGLRRPNSWTELANPIYRDHILMPDPSRSSTGLMIVAGLLQQKGYRKGWAYLDRLRPNIRKFEANGTAPCRRVADGKALIGLGSTYAATKEKRAGAPIDVVLPADGTGWEMESIAIVTGTRNLDAAKGFVDFAVSEEAMEEMYFEDYSLTPRQDVTRMIIGHPAGEGGHMIDSDPNWVADNRDRIAELWNKRYGK